MQTKTVYLSGLAVSEQILMQSYMDLLVLRDGSRFDVTEVREAAQIEVFDPKADAACNSPSFNEPSRIAFLAQGEPSTDHGWALHRPARLSNLREVLTSITSEHAILSNTETALPEHRRLEYWLGLLSRFEAQGEAWELKGLKNLRLRIYFNHQRVYLSNPHQWQEQLANTGRALATAIPSDMEALGDYAISLDRFRWQLCEALSNGLLLPGIASRSTFNLLQWPDFGSVGANQKQMKLSALFHGRDLTIIKAAELSALPVSAVIDFINASAAQGLLKDAPAELLCPEALNSAQKLEQPAPLPEVAKKSRTFGQFLEKLRGAIGLGK